MPKIKVIFLDLDGTLLTSSKKIDEKDRLTLVECLNAGIEIFLVSGRPIFYVHSMADHIDPRVQCLAYNGAFYQGKKGKIDHPFSKETLNQARSLLDFYDIEKCYFKGLDTIYASDEDVRFSYPEWVKKGLIQVKRYTPFSKIQKPIYKIMVLDPREEKLAALAKEASQWLFVTSSHSGSLDMMDPHASKGKAIEALIQMYGWNKENLMAFGDAINDLEMFNQVKYSVAMDNAMAIVKKRAWCITKSHDANGITYAIKKHVEGI